MIDLSTIAGIPIELDSENKVNFVKRIRNIVPDIRTMEQMKPVLMDKTVAKPRECYFMYRDVHLLRDKEFLKQSGLRYDITVIPPAMFGKEFAKTFGHFHPFVPSRNISYPEVYEVLHGTAHYIQQKGKTKVEDVVLIEAKPGDKVVMFPGYGHLTVNPGKEPLVMSNWICDMFSSDYEKVKELAGFCYYETKDGFVKNKHYKVMPKIRKLKPKFVPEFAITREPMYSFGIKNLKLLKFLKNPSDFMDIFDELLEK